VVDAIQSATGTAFEGEIGASEAAEPQAHAGAETQKRTLGSHRAQSHRENEKKIKSPAVALALWSFLFAPAPRRDPAVQVRREPTMPNSSSVTGCTERRLRLMTSIFSRPAVWRRVSSEIEGGEALLELHVHHEPARGLRRWPWGRSSRSRVAGGGVRVGGAGDARQAATPAGPRCCGRRGRGRPPACRRA
jgi:hypothetical protein